MTDKIGREKRMVEIMIRLYCRGAEGNEELCSDCTELLAYAHFRLEHCLFGVKKRSCRSCRIHCYRPEMREKIRRVMRYSGPRMLWHNPWFNFLPRFYWRMINSVRRYSR